MWGRSSFSRARSIGGHRPRTQLLPLPPKARGVENLVIAPSTGRSAGSMLFFQVSLAVELALQAHEFKGKEISDDRDGQVARGG